MESRPRGRRLVNTIDLEEGNVRHAFKLIDAIHRQSKMINLVTSLVVLNYFSTLCINFITTLISNTGELAVGMSSSGMHRIATATRPKLARCCATAHARVNAIVETLLPSLPRKSRQISWLIVRVTVSLPTGRE
ncbi:hypothetical protein J6590_033001 [Homalodisca vitripennis]|nr:hypothetical protein J6590_033001 [Homalodisca vitripennis]